MFRDLKFFWIQRTGRFEVGNQPMMEPASLERFTGALNASSFYMEFGSGGSSVLAAAMGKRMITVESDPFFLSAVIDQIRTNGHLDPKAQKFIHADIGPVGPMGRPLLRWSLNHAKFRGYSSAPWDGLQDFGHSGDAPDLVLIDGRFRVACALKAIRALENRFNMILVDDYARPEYRQIERFARLECMWGRMAVFRPGSRPNLKELEEVIRSVELSPR